MLKRITIILILALTQVACAVDEGGPMFEPAPISAQHLEGAEWAKRELLHLEDIKVGNGSVAAWGRKISADIEVRYANGTLIYQGPIYAYNGVNGTVTIHNSLRKSGALSRQQEGIILGLNGMAVGGKRRITVSPGLVCYQGAIGESTNQGADPNATCLLVHRSGKEGGGVSARKETLTVQATLTESCIPVFLFISVIY